MDKEIKCCLCGDADARIYIEYDMILCVGCYYDVESEDYLCQ